MLYHYSPASIICFILLLFTCESVINAASRVRVQKVPSAPRDIEVVQVNASAVKVSWEKPLYANGDIIGYYVYKDKLLNGEPVNNKLQRAIIYDQHKTHTLITDLEPNTEYSFRVNAFNRHGDGEFSASRKILTGGQPPSEPQTQSVTLLNDEAPLRARVDWKSPKHDYNLPINKYVIWYKPYEHIDARRLEVPGTQNFAILDGLFMGRLYEISIAAENDDGLSLNTTEWLTTPVGIPEAEPLNVRYEISNNQMTITWDPPAIDQRNGNITYYRAVLTPLHPGDTKIERNVTKGRSVTYDVSTRKAYTFKVAAATMKGMGPYSPVLSIDSDPAALVNPPTNVRVQATSLSSVVVQWDFKADVSIDGFVVRYIHEPSNGQRDNERWKAITVMDPSARHVIVPELNAQKPYAFCVLAIRQNRQGTCSEPPTTVDHLEPTYMVANLIVAWKTSNSVMLKWKYDGPQPIGFYVNQTGRKDYLDQHLQLKGMVSPGFRQDLDGHQREHLWTTLRPYTEYTFHVGVRELSPNDKEYWPREVIVRTDPTGPPFVDKPKFVRSDEPGTALIRLRCASEEYGPISHYWLIVVPGNFSQDDVLNLDSTSLHKSTALMRQIQMGGNQQRMAKKVRKVSRRKDRDRRYSHEPHALNGAYIAADIPALAMQQMQRDEKLFVLGDGRKYDDYDNWPLSGNAKYRLMMRAFAHEPNLKNDRLSEFRPPMQEAVAKRYSDSMLSEEFSTKSTIQFRDAKASNLWLIAPLIAIFIIALIVGMLVIWWLRCNRRTSIHKANRHGSISKVALAANTMPGETSKLLATGGDVYGQQIVNPYDQMNGNGGCATEYPLDMYPLQQQIQPPVQLPTVSMMALPSSGGAIGGHTLSHPPVPISELAAHIDRLKMNNNTLFAQEYENIETGQHFTWEHSNRDVNKHKNRYANVVAYDHSRVILSTIDNIEGTDYINANYIDGYEKPKAYIATQGPLPETFADFWRMVWEENSATIVMLTRLEERCRIKCDQYWPMRGSSTYGFIQVTLLDTLELAHYTIRTFRLQQRGNNEVREIRQVRHLQYTAWPDHGVPDHPTPFLMFLKRVKTLNHPDSGPIISHCSAGIGRTGTFIVIDCMLERLRYENTVDIYGCVTALRSQRSYMVQTDDQYVFIHDAVLDAVQSGSTEVPADKLYTHVQALMQIQPVDQVSGMELEFKHLATLKMPATRCSVANLPVNRPKNRLVNMVPYDVSRVILRSIPGEDGSDYINASWIDGYRQRNAYIATQGPLPITVDDFWRMIWEQMSSIIVMLVKPVEIGREKCFEYWPTKSCAKFGTLVIEPIAEYNMPQYTLREFRITDPQTGQTRTIRHFQYVDWPDHGVPKGAELFIDFIQQVHRTKTQFGVDGPITVHCSTGAGRTGVFIALSVIIDRMKLEHVIDVFTTVKLLRTERQNMVQDKEQYQFCYHAAVEFLASYDSPYQMS